MIVLPAIIMENVQLHFQVKIFAIQVALVLNAEMMEIVMLPQQTQSARTMSVLPAYMIMNVLELCTVEQIKAPVKNASKHPIVPQILCSLSAKIINVSPVALTLRNVEVRSVILYLVNV